MSCIYLASGAKCTYAGADDFGFKIIYILAWFPMPVIAIINGAIRDKCISLAWCALNIEVNT